MIGFFDHIRNLIIYIFLYFIFIVLLQICKGGLIDSHNQKWNLELDISKILEAYHLV